MPHKKKKVVIPQYVEKDKMVKPEPIKLPQSVPQINTGELTLEAIEQYQLSIAALKEDLKKQTESSSSSERDSAEGVPHGTKLVGDHQVQWVYRLSSEFLSKVAVLDYEKRLKEYFTLMNQSSILMRSTVAPIMDFLVKKHNALPLKQLLLDGPKGSGKTLTMMQAVGALSHAKSHIILYISDCKKRL
jgi:Tfp pilus assembly pilus retraction ATPase PilT